MKVSSENRDKQKEIDSHTESSLFCPILSEGLDVPTVCWSRNLLSSANVLVLSHHYDHSGTQWNSGEIK